MNRRRQFSMACSTRGDDPINQRQKDKEKEENKEKKPLIKRQDFPTRLTILPIAGVKPGIRNQIAVLSQRPINFGRRFLLRSASCGGQAGLNSTLQNSL